MAPAWVAVGQPILPAAAFQRPAPRRDDFFVERTLSLPRRDSSRHWSRTACGAPREREDSPRLWLLLRCSVGQVPRCRRLPIGAPRRANKLPKAGNQPRAPGIATVAPIDFEEAIGRFTPVQRPLSVVSPFLRRALPWGRSHARSRLFWEGTDPQSAVCRATPSVPTWRPDGFQESSAPIGAYRSCSSSPSSPVVNWQSRRTL